MIDLLKKFSITDIVFFMVLFLLASKELINIIGDVRDKGIGFFDRTYQKPKQTEKQIKELIEAVDILKDKVDMLVESDRDDIKAFIIRQHHYFCYQLKQIDDQSLDCIQKRYAHYEGEGGNSYIPDLMKDLRNLPKCPPNTMKKYN